LLILNKPHRQLSYTVDQVRAQIRGSFHPLHDKIAFQDFFQETARLRLGEAIAGAAMLGEAKRNVLARVNGLR